MTGAEYIAEFPACVGSDRVFTLTRGTCAFRLSAYPGLREAHLDYVLSSIRTFVKAERGVEAVSTGTAQ